MYIVTVAAHFNSIGLDRPFDSDGAISECIAIKPHYPPGPYLPELFFILLDAFAAFLFYSSTCDAFFGSEPDDQYTVSAKRFFPLGDLCLYQSHRLSVLTCGPTLISWTGGVEPYTLQLLANGKFSLRERVEVLISN